MVQLFLALACLLVLGYGSAKVIKEALLAFYTNQFDIDEESYTFTDTPTSSSVPTMFDLLRQLWVGLTLLVTGTVGLIYTVLV